MMRLIVLLGIGIFLIIIIYGSPWTVRYSIPQDHKIECIFFSSNSGLLGGHFLSTDKRVSIKNINRMMSMHEAIILKTNDSGKSWRKVFSGKGEIIRFDYQSERGLFFALGREYTKYGEKKSYLLISKNQGEDWETDLEFSFHFNNFKMSSTHFGYIWDDYDIYRYLYDKPDIEKLGFKSLFSMNHPQPVVNHKNNLIAVSYKNFTVDERERVCWDKCGNSVVEIDSDKIINSSKLPPNLDLTHVTVDSYNDIWLLGVEIKSDSIELFRLNKFEIYEKINEFEHFLPIALHISKSTICIFGSYTNLHPPTRILFISKDGGKNWEELTFKIPDGISAIFFEEDKKIWTTCSKNRLQCYELE